MGALLKPLISARPCTLRDRTRPFDRNKWNWVACNKQTLTLVHWALHGHGHDNSVITNRKGSPTTNKISTVDQISLSPYPPPSPSSPSSSMVKVKVCLLQATQFCLIARSDGHGLANISDFSNALSTGLFRFTYTNNVGPIDWINMATCNFKSLMLKTNL